MVTDRRRWDPFAPPPAPDDEGPELAVPVGDGGDPTGTSPTPTDPPQPSVDGGGQDGPTAEDDAGQEGISREEAVAVLLDPDHGDDQPLMELDETEPHEAPDPVIHPADRIPADLDDIRGDDLKALAREAGVPDYGSKQQIADRIRAARPTT